MSKMQIIKRLVLVVVGFGFSAYLMYSGITILSKEENNQTKGVEIK